VRPSGWSCSAQTCSPRRGEQAAQCRSAGVSQAPLASACVLLGQSSCVTYRRLFAVQGVARGLRRSAGDAAAIRRFADAAQWSDNEAEYDDEYDDSFDDLQGGAADGVADVEGACPGRVGGTKSNCLVPFQ